MSYPRWPGWAGRDGQQKGNGALPTSTHPAEANHDETLSARRTTTEVLRLVRFVSQVVVPQVANAKA